MSEKKPPALGENVVDIKMAMESFRKGSPKSKKKKSPPDSSFGSGDSSKEKNYPDPLDIELYRLSGEMTQLIRRTSTSLEASDLAGLLALFARDLAELEFADMPQGIDRDEKERHLKRFLCSLILDKSELLKALGKAGHPLTREPGDI